MAGSVNKSLILVKAEATAGTFSTPTAAADAFVVLASGLSIKIDPVMADRDIITGAFVGKDQLSVTRRGKVSFSVELGGSGAAGTAAKWGVLLKAAANAETVTAGSRAEYNPISTALGTVSIVAEYNGILYNLRYASGTFKVSGKVGEVGQIQFDFTCLVSTIAAGTAGAATFANQVRSVAVSPTNTTGMSVGAVTYSAGAITGGMSYAMRDFEIDGGLDVQDVMLTTSEVVGIYGRDPKVSFTVDMTAAAEAALYADMDAGTSRAIGFVHGTVAGNKVGVYCPSMVITGIEDVTEGPVLIVKVSGVLRPTAAGNDEYKIWAM